METQPGWSAQAEEFCPEFVGCQTGIGGSRDTDVPALHEEQTRSIKAWHCQVSKTFDFH